MPTDFESELLRQRNEMVQIQLRKRGIHDERVLNAMAMVPRHEFVPWQLQREAYRDSPVPIGEGQTISQPYIVAYMLQALRLHFEDEVLEVGTGTGYAAAVMSRIVREVYTIERFETLAGDARKMFAQLGYENVHVIVGDGSEGYASAAPYDAIVVAAAAPRVPEALLSQLKKGSRMVLPVGSSELQQLLLVTKHDGEVDRRYLDACRFVPLIGKQGYAVEH
ncbi:MAG TPA: protein-L-isoaspartate(D-aspartate) O-methyltransferase [Terriglobales bacterium]|nr:protein-L-isoaspartate(D-aspartate) O-methyltransferase [Terriglobales bacterium]